MEDSFSTSIDYKILELLTKAPSKKYLRKFLEYCFLFRNKTKAFEELLQTPVATQFSQDFQINEEQTHKLVLNVLRLIEQASARGFKEIDNLFPENFHEQLKKLLGDLFENYKEIWLKQVDFETCQADKLLDFDWRLDMRVASRNGTKQNEPFVLFQIETMSSQEENQRNKLTFQMNGQEVNTLYNNMKKIKDQLNLLISE